ncbi:hypothetical protein BH24BAC1_BH24BAC1_25760 [soil metagenome]
MMKIGTTGSQGVLVEQGQDSGHRKDKKSREQNDRFLDNHIVIRLLVCFF